MKACFFGHRDASPIIKPQLSDVICRLIEEQRVTEFYVGSQGTFDRLVQKVLLDMINQNSGVQATVVLAYLPGTVRSETALEGLHTVYPEGLERVPRRFAIARRNAWMIDFCDILVVYASNPVGGAWKAREAGKKKGKIVIDIVVRE